MTTTPSLTLHKMAFALLAIGAFCLGLSATAGAAPYRRAHGPGIDKTYAGKHDGKHKAKGKRDRMTRMMNRFDELDVNNDGRIGWFELRAAPKPFRKRIAAANTNRDFFVTRAEFRAHCAKHKGKRGKGKGKYKGKTKRDARRGNGAVIRDHRAGTVAPLLPSRPLERVPSRRARHTR